MKRHISPKKLGALSVAAGAATLGAVSTADAGLQVYDHRAAPIYAITEYFLFNQTLAVLNVKTGDFQYVVEQGGNGGETDGVNTPDRYNQDGFVDNNLIPETDLTADTVWLSHRDVDVDVGWGPKAGDVVTVETPTGGAGGTLDAAQGPVFTNREGDPATWEPHDWYWADQSGTAATYPADPGSAGQVDGAMSFNDSSPTGYTGVVTHGFGGLGHGSGSSFGVYPNPSAIPFKLEEGDGTHYGWVAVQHNEDRNRVWIHGWAYQTTPGAPADLTWIGDAGGVVGDFDGDGDVDADDVDDLCANMGGDAGTYDMDGDGDVDEDDMTFHVENYLEYDSDGDGTADGQGTFRGDFNTDGTVNGTDLSILSGGFGTTTGFAGGNANCDTTVNGTDLSILSGVFGNVVTAAVPEPVTITLLSLGGVALLRRRGR